MRDDRPSSTAAIVCAARAEIAARPTIRDFEEPFAERLLPPWYSLESGSGAQRGVARAFRRVSRGGAHIIALRMVAIDEGIRTAGDFAQFVILGAGLDARAWRMPELRELPVYEVDHPATQAYKRRRAQDFGELANHHYVSVDFERESLEDKLAEAGHDPDVPTVWVWEGVTMYLNLPAIEGTLGVLERRSAPGSRLLVTYMPPSALRFLVGVGTAIVSDSGRSFGQRSWLNSSLATSSEWCVTSRRSTGMSAGPCPVRV